ncbi:hypothetical protein N1028_13230 [Herbiconiux sp. CPCC 203407]|uniref:Uncharacterized protein n=1 Tax=Herbiconiux oxytropis TaxID=2970915 RepID=A0AA41XER7_9MICO|nr:hypothetical protein [Herbiconiux oxytropis]MCS5723075.1 hypothetical protein [Herbiconiux oxytropis]MCS5726856.1 hypothetical protein [Herbiconiux oxytropis]
MSHIDEDATVEPPELTALATLPKSIGSAISYAHRGTVYWLSPVASDRWVVGKGGSNETVAFLAKQHPARFTLEGPGVLAAGESWLLLLARL